MAGGFEVGDMFSGEAGGFGGRSERMVLAREMTYRESVVTEACPAAEKKSS